MSKMTSQQLKKRKSKISSLVSMIRPANSILVGFAVIVGIAVASNNYHEIFTLRSLFGFLTGFFISSFSMVSNDIYDAEVDRVNQPDRPIPNGTVSKRQATSFAIVLLVLGTLASAALGVLTFGIAVVFAFIGWYYNYRGKQSGLFGNTLVALSLAIPYIFGSVSLGDYRINLGYILALTSFLAGMGREVLKGISDVEGDKVRNVKTVAVTRGTKTARVVTSVFFILAVLTSALPPILGLLGKAIIVYSGLIGVVDVIFLYLAIAVLRMKDDKDSLKLKGIALGGMMLGLIAYLISGLLA